MWRAALTHVGNLAGWPLMNRPFSQVIKSIENIEKVKMWRYALTHVGNLAGWPLMNRPFSQVIKSIQNRTTLDRNKAFSKVEVH
ncbi:hypothetical protein CMV_022126 [Castanea mollissima]|uniref:Uncharacterized protein n=1 Tax=Castanea mollissima TaxID=60419 RepID=A0A8J4VJY5_9ROSI|nr:hypothetical protein CMV_022126 [Castanea mollissima]